MNDVPGELRYTKSHEWVRRMENGHFEVGITDHAQDQLGDMVFMELPEVGSTLGAGDECAVVESVKAASDVYNPINGEIVEANTALDEYPELVNQSPYADGWLFRLKPDDGNDWDELLDADAYREIAESD
ncbi:MAG: Glycine cleavage system H protein [Gammaproteobacteria bacterium]|nr:Glycine cleavage system H protein [Gammaproteobacteria bacterium]